MRCKNCGLENDDHLYICQNCGSPLYDEEDINNEDSTVEFKKISGNDEPNQPEQKSQQNNNNDNRSNNNNDDNSNKKQLTTTIIVLCVILVAIIAGIIGAVIANGNKDDELTTSSTVASTTTPTTLPSTTNSSTTTAIAQYMVTVRSNEGGNVDGGGQFTKGEQIKITAQPNNGYNFLGWYTPNGVLVTQSLSHTFTLSEDIIFEAKFEKANINKITTTVKQEQTKPAQNNETTKKADTQQQSSTKPAEKN